MQIRSSLKKYLSITEVNRFILLIFLSLAIFIINPFFLHCGELKTYSYMGFNFFVNGFGGNVLFDSRRT